MAGRTSISYSVAGLGEICALVLLVLHVACDLADVVTCLHVGHGVGGGHGDVVGPVLLCWRLLLSHCFSLI